mmetsp:Transcript_2922/g.3426  ORF Transcript_2922/g.3426 Transcript_2922/m.3426 type:complete len:369 (-) Transcript_2922:564-1670(-)
MAKAKADSKFHKLRRRKRWEAAVNLLEATTEERKRFDHRAKYAQLIGIYVGEDDKFKSEGSTHIADNILVAMQPDQGGRKLLFLDAIEGKILGFIELETQSSISNNKMQQKDIKNAKVANDDAKTVPVAVPVTSALRGMLVSDGCRGKGYARLFLAIWLKLCLRADVTPATTRINKPLLALTLVRLGFTPLRGHHLATISYENHLRGSVREKVNGKGGKKQRNKKLKEKHRPLAVEVSVGKEGKVLLYSPLSTERLRNGFSETEVRSQRLMVTKEPSEPRGRIAHLRVRYAPPPLMVNVHTSNSNQNLDETQQNDDKSLENLSQIVHSPLTKGIGGRLRFSASQAYVDDMHVSALEREEALRLLTGLL